MCGLIGIFHGRTMSDDEKERIKDLFTQLLLANEERGREATGVAAFWPDGRHLILKRPVPASDFIITNEYKTFLNRLDPHVCSLLGHTRKPTKGTPFQEENNHPLMVGETVGIHNGTIKNDMELYEESQQERFGQVDSEVIFSLLDQVKPRAYNNRYPSEIQELTKRLTGSFTTLSVHLSCPQEVLVLKYDQPVSYHYSRSLHSLFFSSRYIFLRKAFGKQVITEALQSKTAFVFNLMAKSRVPGEAQLSFPIVAAKTKPAPDTISQSVPG